MSVADGSRASDKFRVAVTGDHGHQVFTRYKAGCIQDDQYYPEIANDIDVPSGAGLLLHGLRELLNASSVEILDALPRSGAIPQSLQFLHTFDWNDKRVLRINRAAPLRMPEEKPDDVDLQNLPSHDCLVIHDATSTWRKSGKVAKWLEGGLRNASSQVIVNSGENIPSLGIDKKALIRVRGKESPVWEMLHSIRDKVTVICSATSLRHAGAAISRRLSWEQTVEDTMADLQLFETLRCLSMFKHLIIRFGFVGAIHLSREPRASSRPFKAQLIYAPMARGGIFRDQVEHGRVLGRNCAIIASLLNTMADVRKELTNQQIEQSVKAGLSIGMKLFDQGYSCTSKYLKKRGPRSPQTKVLAPSGVTIPGSRCSSWLSSFCPKGLYPTGCPGSKC